jgi:hypothetical protein
LYYHRHHHPAPRHLHEVSNRRVLQKDPSDAGHHKTGYEETPAREEEVHPRIKILVETEVTEVIEVDKLVDTTPGDSF